MLPTIYLPEKPDSLLRTPPTGLTQRFLLDDVFIEINCDFVIRSFSEFAEPERYCHPNPAVSRLILVEHGRVRLESADRTEVLTAGQLYLLPAGLAFTAEYLDHCVTKGFHLNLYDGGKFSIADDLDRAVILDSPPLFKAIRAALDETDQWWLASAVMAAVVAALREAGPKLKARAAAPLLYRRVLADLRQMPPARIRLETSARKFHLTPAALAKGFSRLFGIT